MATSQATPVEKKPKFALTVKWQSENGDWNEATSERSFEVPDQYGKISVTIVTEDGKGSTDVDRVFERVVFHNERDVVNMLQSNPLFVISALNYGSDLYCRGTIKGPIAAQVEGPGKTLRKMAEQFIASRRKLGKPELNADPELALQRAIEIVTAMNDAS